MSIQSIICGFMNEHIHHDNHVIQQMNSILKELSTSSLNDFIFGIHIKYIYIFILVLTKCVDLCYFITVPNI